MKGFGFPRLENAWTGGAYSLWRFVLGTYLLTHFAALLPHGTELFSSAGLIPEAESSPLGGLFPSLLSLADPPWLVAALLFTACLASLALGLGLRDRPAAWVLVYILACLHVRNPLIANPSLPYVGLVLALHALIPVAPFGSLHARGRVDPSGGWRFPPEARALLWILLMAGYTFSGVHKLDSPSWRDGSALARVLENPLARDSELRTWILSWPSVLLRGATYGALALELAAAPLALWKPARPFLAFGFIAMHLGIACVVDFADLTFGMLIVHLLALDPAWISRRPGGATVYYDGECGVCHGFVRLLLSEDRTGALRFAPLQSESLLARLGPEAVSQLPDSVLVLDNSGKAHLQSDGVIAALAHLEGPWRVAGVLLRWIPRPLRELGYRGIARIRHRLVSKPKGLCPLLPPTLSSRFDP